MSSNTSASPPAPPSQSCPRFTETVNKLEAYWAKEGEDGNHPTLKEWPRLIAEDADKDGIAWNGPAGASFPQDTIILRKWYTMATKIIFNDLITDSLCPISFHGKETTEWKHGAEGGKTFGSTPNGRANNKAWANISIYEMVGYFKTRKDRLYFYFSTILHEIVHAILSLTRCICDACWTDPTQAYLLGATCHGPAWLILSRMVQTAANDWCNMGYINLGIVDGLTLEIKTRGLMEGPEVERLRGHAGLTLASAHENQFIQHELALFNRWMKGWTSNA